MSIDAEGLNELQQQIRSGDLPDASQIDALVTEIWRLKTLLRGKAIELDAARSESSDLERLLEALIAENDSLRAEIEQLKAVHGLPVCQLEGRWSNCAVRLRKCGENPSPEDPANE
ncbi:MAG TPA: hypothetical protein VMT61_14745 [Candidatus Binataceae bacterium]|nr:hypothetical protein [Candidatus Binataceae bacterium]